MSDEGKGVGLVILGVVAIVAVVGLVLLFRSGGATGAQIAQPPLLDLCENDGSCNPGGCPAKTCFMSCTVQRCPPCTYHPDPDCNQRVIIPVAATQTTGAAGFGNPGAPCEDNGGIRDVFPPCRPEDPTCVTPCFSTQICRDGSAPITFQCAFGGCDSICTNGGRPLRE